MAVYRTTPKCFKCGKKQIGIYQNQSHLPMNLRIIGDTFERWEHDGKCVGETEEYKMFISNAEKIQKILTQETKQTK
jgi:hypothetical protein